MSPKPLMQFAVTLESPTCSYTRCACCQWAAALSGRTAKGHLSETLDAVGLTEDVADQPVERLRLLVVGRGGAIIGPPKGDGERSPKPFMQLA